MTAPFVAGDEDVRRAIRDSIDANACVEASAGTGKTTVLVERVVRILASGHAKVHELAVITFTEKAAAELAARVRAGLEEAREGCTDAVERARLDDAIAGLNHAQIETIHAFAASLLRERPVEADLAPGFDVLDEFQTQLAFDEAYEEWLTAETGGDERPAALVDALNLGLRVKLVREAALTLDRHRDLLPLPGYDLLPVGVDGLLLAMARCCGQLRGLESCALNPDDLALAELRRMVTLERAWSALRAQPAALRRAIAMAAPPKKNAGSQDNWRDADDCRRVKALLRELADEMTAVAGAMKSNSVAMLLGWLQRFVIEYEKRRKQQGKAQFFDLLLWARNLLREDVSVREYFAAKYRCVLVDEFQDTDPLQVEMIVYLCAERDTRDWRAVTLRPGSLFVVGDPKQSIYRFRRADIGMYDNVKASVLKETPRVLVQNFRSARPIVEWVNRTFSALMDARPGVQAAYSGIEADPRIESQDAAAVTLMPFVPQPSNGRVSAADVRRSEADGVATMIAEAVAGEAWRLGDGTAARFGDIVMLIPSRTELQLYEDALAQVDVPYRHEGGRSFFVRQEVRELAAILRAIDDPADAVGTVAALRSPAFGCSDEDLFVYRANGGTLDYARARIDGEGRAERSLRTLRALAGRRHALSLPELVRTVIDTSALVEFAMLQRQGEQAGANLLKVIDQARAFEETGGGLRAFVRWLKLNTAGGSDEPDAPISEQTDDVVRIVTIHASKGLEFPVVVFANMNTERSDLTKAIADRGHGRLQLKLGKREEGFLTPGYEAAEATEHEHTEAEEKRLLYVAATRAKDRLVIPYIAADGQAGKSSPKPERTLNEWLARAGAFDGVKAAPVDRPPLQSALPVWRHERGAVDDAAVERALAERDAWKAGRAELLARAHAPLRVLTASAMKEELTTPHDDTDVIRRARATDFGVAVHALLERIDLARADTVRDAATAIAAEFGLLGREDEIARVATNALRSECVARAVRSRRLLREATFTLALPGNGASAAGGFAEGRIDLLFEEGGGLVIVDFKTDAVSAAQVEEKASEYRTQALVYTWAAERATRMPVREIVFLFARVPAETAIAVDEAVRSEAAALVEGWTG